MALPHLRTITGNLIVTSSESQKAVHLPALTSVGQSVLVSGNDGLRVLDLPNLTSVGGGHVHAIVNASLAALDLPALTSPDSLVVDRNAGLARLSLPVLSTVGLLAIDSNPALASISLPAVTEVMDSMWLTDLPSLPAVDLPALQVVGTQPYPGGLTLAYLNGATHISLPALRSVRSGFSVFGNEVLATLVVPALDMVGSLQVGNSIVYPECEATALRDHLVASCGLQDARIGGNDTTATCGQ